MQKEYTLIRSNRRTIGISVSNELRIIVRVPNKMPVDEVESIITKHQQWIEKQIERVKQLTNERQILTNEEIEALKKKAKAYLPHRVKHFAEIMNVKPKAIKVTSATTRWGSCSAKNNLCFPYRVMLLPEELIDYIIIHELAHIKEKNHSSRFYNIVATFLPDYKQRELQLKEQQRILPHS